MKEPTTDELSAWLRQYADYIDSTAKPLCTDEWAGEVRQSTDRFRAVADRLTALAAENALLRRDVDAAVDTLVVNGIDVPDQFKAFGEVTKLAAELAALRVACRPIREWVNECDKAKEYCRDEWHLFPDQPKSPTFRCVRRIAKLLPAGPVAVS